MKRRLSRGVAVVFALLGACNPILGIEDVTVVEDAGGLPPRDGGGDATTPSDAGDAAKPPEAGGDAGADVDAGPPLPQPDPGCLMPTRAREQTTILTTPSPATTSTPLGVIVRDTQTGHTNVNLAICTPTSPTLMVNDQATVGGGVPFNWTWDIGTLPRGVTQIGFRADPNGDTLYETILVEVR